MYHKSLVIEEDPLSSTAKFKAVIYGEMHTPAERLHVERLIREHHKQKPFHYLLSEELGPYRYRTPEEIRKAIKDKMYSISDRSFHLALELNMPVIGIDVWSSKIHRLDKKDERGFYTDCRESFYQREMYMVDIIRRYKDHGRCAVIVGDSHLRLEANTVMGEASPISTSLGSDTLIIRSSNKEVK